MLVGDSGCVVPYRGSPGTNAGIGGPPQDADLERLPTSALPFKAE